MSRRVVTFIAVGLLSYASAAWITVALLTYIEGEPVFGRSMEMAPLAMPIILLIFGLSASVGVDWAPTGLQCAVAFVVFPLLWAVLAGMMVAVRRGLLARRLARGAGVALLASLVMASPCDVNAAAVDSEALAQRVDALAAPLIESERVVGMVVGVIRGDDVVVRAYGETGRGSGERPDGKTVYELASLSKTFTGVLLADAAVRGDVALDDSVNKHWGDDAALPARKGKPITLVGLATHTSGLPRMPGNFKPADPGNPYADYTIAQMLDFLRTHKLRRDPGTVREYSNLGFALLGQTLGRVAGKTYAELLAERITGPLGMRDTAIVYTDATRERVAPPYGAGGEPAKTWDLPTFAGGGGIRSTVDDMLLYLRAHLDAERLSDRAGAQGTLARAMVSAMTKRYEDDNGGMALGWHIARDGRSRVHNGQTGGYHTYLAVIPESGAAVVVLSNTADGIVSRFGEQVIRTAVGIDEKPLELERPVKLDAAALDRCVGTYRLFPNFAIAVERRGDRLYAQATGQQALRIHPRSATEFVYRDVDARIVFDRFGEDGKAGRLTLFQHGREMPGERVTDGAGDDAGGRP